MTKPKLPWLTFKEAISLLKTMLPAEVDAYETIIAALKTGSVPVKCVIEVIPNGTLVTGIELLKHRLQTIRPEPVKFSKVPQKVREAAESIYCGEKPLCYIGDHGDWNTEEDNYLIAKYPDDDVNLHIISDISVKEHDLLHFIDKRLSMQTFVADGRPRNETAWLNFCAAMIFLERTGDLNIESLTSPAQLEKKICELIDDQLDQRTIHRDVRTLFELFVGPEELTAAMASERRKSGEEINLVYEVKQAGKRGAPQ